MPQNARSKEYLGAEQFGLIVTGLNVLSAVGPFAIAATQYRNQRTGDAFLARMALGLTGLSAVALAWVDLSFLLIPVCDGQ